MDGLEGTRLPASPRGNRIRRRGAVGNKEVARHIEGSEEGAGVKGGYSRVWGGFFTSREGGRVLNVESCR
jgi:hypothetical protein